MAHFQQMSRKMLVSVPPSSFNPFDAHGFLKTAPEQPGIYQMLDADGSVIYVGKARNLKKRLSSYFRGQVSRKTQWMLQHLSSIELTLTHSETEALLLECNLIKALKPRFNILLRDDKSYPYLYLSTQETYPTIQSYRGRPQSKGRYFGPYPSGFAVRDTIAVLKKLFLLRSCRDDFFSNRSRPCLEYQIKRCSAPCVKYITPEAYAQDVQNAILFLEGKDQQVIQALAQRMEAAAEQLAFEHAAELRNLISQLRTIQANQAISGNHADTDVLAVAYEPPHACVQVFMVRQGRVLGSKSWFPEVPVESQSADILAAFVAQYYLNQQATRDIPPQVLLSEKIAGVKVLAAALSAAAQRQVKLSHSVRGDRLRWLEMAQKSAAQAIQSRVSERASYTQQLKALQEVLSLSELPTRLECFDISHSQGEATTASCVVFGDAGPIKNHYRRYHIEGITPGDDYAAMHQALTRRYQRLQSEEGALPDILLIDGGKGQLSQAQTVLSELNIEGIQLVGVAKGEGRKPGLETLHFIMRDPLHLDDHHLALHLIQRIRDEAHRFAITGHRQRRDKQRKTSTLESIAGLGAHRRRQLLRHFGGLNEVKRASVEELKKVSGIGEKMAKVIFETLHR